MANEWILLNYRSAKTTHRNVTNGQVYLNSYYDFESNKTYTPTNNNLVSGTKYLGSEIGYIIDNTTSKHQFGKGYYEADLISNFYDFNYKYSDGDSYTGKVYAMENYGYAVGSTKTVSTNGTLTGQYSITAINHTDTISVYNGSVYVNNYYDSQSGKSFSPVNIGNPVGNNYLGSEGDYIIENNIPNIILETS